MNKVSTIETPINKVAKPYKDALAGIVAVSLLGLLVVASEVYDLMVDPARLSCSAHAMIADQKGWV